MKNFENFNRFKIKKGDALAPPQWEQTPKSEVFIKLYHNDWHEASLPSH